MPVSDFSSLYHHSYPLLYRLVASIYTNPFLIEDVLQEIYLAAWVRFRDSTHPNPYGWLIITARHKAYDMLRRHLREGKYLVPFCADPGSLSGTDPESASSELIDQLSEREQPYAKFLPLLNENELVLLISYYEEGYSVAELSRQMNISAGACYMRLHRARKKLEPLIDQH